MRAARHLNKSHGAAGWFCVLAMMALIWLGSARADGARAAIGVVRGAIIDAFAGAADWPRLGFLVQKTGHFIEYLLLAWLLLGALQACNLSHHRATGIALTISLAYAILDEWHQSFVPGREPALRDVLIDFAGALAAIVLSSFGRHRPSRRVPATPNE